MEKCKTLRQFHLFGKEKCKTSSPISAILRWRHFLLSLSISLSLSLYLSLSLSLSLSHRAHLSHSIASASALPIIKNNCLCSPSQRKLQKLDLAKRNSFLAKSSLSQSKRVLIKVLLMANSVFSETYVYTPSTPCKGCEILPKHSRWRSFMKFVDRSHVTSSNQRFSNFKTLKKLTRKHLRRIAKWLVWQFCLVFFSMDEIVKMYGRVFLYSNPLGSYEQSKFSRVVAKLKIAHHVTSQWIWIESFNLRWPGCARCLLPM